MGGCIEDTCAWPSASSCAASAPPYLAAMRLQISAVMSISATSISVEMSISDVHLREIHLRKVGLRAFAAALLDWTLGHRGDRVRALRLGGRRRG